MGKGKAAQFNKIEPPRFDVQVAWAYLKAAAEDDITQRGDKSLWLQVSTAEALAASHFARKEKEESEAMMGERIAELERELAAAQTVPAHGLGNPPPEVEPPNPVKPFEVVPDAADG